jgi:hypothetical protein
LIRYDIELGPALTKREKNLIKDILIRDNLVLPDKPEVTASSVSITTS